MAFETTPTRFVDIARIGGGGFGTVPVVEIGPETIGDSFDLALRLEEAHADAAPLFAGSGGVALTRFVAAQASHLLGKMSRPMVLAIHDALDPDTRVYFRASREKMFKATLEEVAADPERSVAAAREALTPFRNMLKKQDHLGGAEPLFADFRLAGRFQWARVVGAVDYLDGEERIAAWFSRIEARHGAVLAATKG